MPGRAGRQLARVGASLQTVPPDSTEALTEVKKQNPYLQTLFDLFFVGLGLWTVFCHLFVFSGRTFNELVRWSILPLALFVLAVLYRKRAQAGQSHEIDDGRPEILLEDADHRAATEKPISWLPWAGGAAAIVGFYYLTGNFLLWWLASITFVSVILLKTKSSGQPSPSIAPATGGSAPTWLVLLLLGLLTFFVSTIFVPNPNWESTFYLSMGVSSAEFPDRVLLRNDWLHGEPNLPPLGFHYLAHSRELLIATLSHFTGIEQQTLFYVVFPRIVLAMAIVVHWLALRQFGISWRISVLGILLVSLVWMSWGGERVTLGRWTFASLTTGKGALVALGVPAVFYSAARYRDNPSWLCWSVFACTLISAVGLSSSGIVVASLTAAFVLVSGLKRTRAALIQTAWGFAPMAYIALVALAIVMVEASEASRSTFEQMVRVRGTAEEGLRSVLGVATAGPRPYLALFCLLALPTIPMDRPGQRQKLQAVVLGILLLVLNPVVPVALSGLVGNMWWRSFWSVPFPLLIGLTGAMLVSVRIQLGRVPLNLVCFALLALAFTLAPHPWAISKRNFKLPWHENRFYFATSGYGTAHLIKQHFTPADLLWVPERVAMWLISFERHPRLITVRRIYVRPILGPLGERETTIRRVLHAWMDLDLDVPDEAVAKEYAARLKIVISRYGISGVVLKEGSELHRIFATVLRDEGFMELPTTGGYTLWKARRSGGRSSRDLRVPPSQSR